ncbi:YgjV family protein [Candidatus Woesearchaeota archaeon]|nr:YgjV family protein [Candidatus Woesearchaeota archaeon]
MLGLFKIIGALGIVFITLGILTKQRKMQDLYYIFGGVCLEVYSLLIGDIIFIILQIIFLCAVVYDIIRIKRAETTTR